MEWWRRRGEKWRIREREKTKSFQGLCDVDTLGLWGEVEGSICKLLDP